MDLDQTVARCEADKARVCARLSAPSAEPKGRVFGLAGMEVFDAIFSGDLPPAPRRVIFGQPATVSGESHGQA